MVKAFRKLCLVGAVATSALSFCACSAFGNKETQTVTETIKSETVVQMTESSISLVVGGTVTLSFSSKTDGVASTDAVLWLSSDDGVASVDNGVVTGVGTGTATITAFCGDRNASVTVQVTPAPVTEEKFPITIQSAAHGTVSANAIEAPAGATIAVSATPENGYRLETLKYNSTDITDTRTFTMPMMPVTISATFVQGAQEEDVSTSLTVVQKNVSLKVGSTLTLTAVSSAGLDITWSSSDESVAKVTDGVITGRSEGNAVITVRSGKAVCLVNIAVTAAASGDPALDKDGYTLTWHDEFDGTALDTTKWGYHLGIQDDYGGAKGAEYWGNGELQYYTSAQKNVKVEDGSLQITAIRENMDWGRTFSSARIHTRDKFSQTFGYFEARMQTPAKPGMWPAFWMLPQPNTYGNFANDYGTWAANGEIDIMEAKGRLQTYIDMTLHCGGAWPNNYWIPNNNYYVMSTTTEEWHTYAVDWTADYIEWYIDGVSRQRLHNSQWTTTASSAPSAPFDKPFYILLNLAVGGTYDGGVAPDASFTQDTMKVDYVRVWQKN